MKEQTESIWGRIGRSLLGNALYFAGCGVASCAVFGFEQGLVAGALSGWLRPFDTPLVFSMPLALTRFFGAGIGDLIGAGAPVAATGLFGAGIGGLIGAATALPLFAIVGVVRGAAPRASQRDELFRVCTTSQRAALLCGLAGMLSGPLLSFLTHVPLWALWPRALPSSEAGDLWFGGALSGLIIGNIVGLWLGALRPDVVENLAERHRIWRVSRKSR